MELISYFTIYIIMIIFMISFFILIFLPEEKRCVLAFIVPV